MLEQPLRGGIVAPVQKAPFAFRVGLDHVDAGQEAGENLHAPGADAFGLPGREHLLAPGVVAERGDVIHRYAEAGEIDGRVQGVAAEAAAEQRLGQFAQFHHAFADRCDAGGHGCTARRAPCA